MKLRYFGYYLRQFDTQQKFLFNIKPIVDAFISSKNMTLKSNFKRGNDKLYLTNVLGYKNLYYFVRTSDDDYLKRINEQSLTVSDITSQLQPNEKVAYASYVYISPTDGIIACASSTSCPRFDELADYINELFSKISLKNYNFFIDALTSNTDKTDLMKMKMVNSVYIDVAADKTLSRLIAKELTGHSDTRLGNLRITIEPEGINLKKAFVSMLSRLVPNGKVDNTQGVISIGAKAKHDELKGQLNDYWLDNENTLSDSLNPRLKTKLPDQITAKYDANLQLAELYKLYVDNNSLTVKSDALLQHYTDKASFAKKQIPDKVTTTAPANDEDVKTGTTEASV
jgi:hypothetical protein